MRSFSINSTVSGQNAIGGLVGAAFPIYLSDSYSNNQITSTGFGAGGIIGSHNGNNLGVYNSYFYGSVTGSGDVGGVFGYGSSVGGTLSAKNSYSTSQNITGSTFFGATIGRNLVGSVNVTNLVHNNASFAGDLASEALVRDAATSGWDFVNTWKGPYNNSAHPKLFWEP